MTALTTATDALAGTLAEQQRLCADLLVLSDREEQAIMASDIEALTALIEEKEQLLELLATLETERMTALTAIAAATGRPLDALTLSQVVDYAMPASRQALVATGEALERTGVALQQANSRNAQLLQMSSGLIDKWVSYLKLVISGSLTYDAGGASQGASGNRMLDRSA